MMTNLRNHLARTAMMLFLAMLTTATAWAQFGGGDGTEGNPYIISTTTHFNNLASRVNSQKKTCEGEFFRLDEDLDYSGKTFTPVGHCFFGDQIWFRGTFDGNYHAINNVSFYGTDSKNGQGVGLFGYVIGGTIKNLTLGGNSSIRGFYHVGGIVGLIEEGVVENCHTTSDVTIGASDSQSQGKVGGIVGSAWTWRGNLDYQPQVRITGCTNAATITINGVKSATCLGGIVGFMSNYDNNLQVAPVTISDCVNTGTVAGSEKVGGIVGGAACLTGDTSGISGCTNFGTVTGSSYVGGILGNDMADPCSISDCAVGGDCNIGAVGAEGSSQGSDEGYGVTHLYTAKINYAQVKSGTIDTPPTKTIDGTGYYAPGTVITLSGLYTFGTPAGGGMMWNYRAVTGYDNYVDVLPQEDGTWQFTMPMGNVTINPSGAKDITLTEYPYATRVTLTPASADYSGSSQKPTVSIVCRSKDLTEGTDFITDIPAAGYTAPGDYTFHIWGIGDYGGLRMETFSIMKAPLTQLTLSETMVYYDGASHKPTLTVKAGSKTLVRGRDYETDLPDEGFTDLGIYPVTVWGIGNYTGEMAELFTIKHPWNGDGSFGNPFLINNTDDMDLLASFVNSGKDYAGVYFRQKATLDYTGKTYTPVGDATHPFNGEFACYGGGMFKGVTISGTDYAGLFGNVGSQGSLYNIEVDGTCTFSGGTYTGALAAYNTGKLNGVKVGTATVVGNQYVGGVAGHNGGEISTDVVEATVSLGSEPANIPSVGGVAGSNSGTIYAQCQANITARGNVGGIVGVCSLAGTVTGTFSGDITTVGTSSNVGGIVGNNSGTVESCLNVSLMNNVSGVLRAGAIIGKNNMGKVSHNYYIGECSFGGISGADVLNKAMRGWPIIADEEVDFMPDYSSDEYVGTYYDDGTLHAYYVGAGETLRFMLFSFTSTAASFTANGETLTPAGVNEWDETYYELVMPAEPVYITLAYLPGDANGDGKVDIADVTAVINHINNASSDTFNQEAADANHDGTIDIGDVTGIINIINAK